MNIKSGLYALLGALSGVFLCALLGVNFSQGMNSTEVQDVPSSAQENSGQFLMDNGLNSNSNFAELQRLRAQLSFCQMDLQRAQTDAFQNNLNNR